MKKGISGESLADRSYCDTSSIYLVTSGRKDPYCAKKNVSGNCLSGLERALGGRRAVVQRHGPSAASGRFPHLRGVPAGDCEEPRPPTGLGVCLPLALWSAGNHGWQGTAKFRGPGGTLLCCRARGRRAATGCLSTELRSLVPNVSAASGSICAENFWWYRLPLEQPLQFLVDAVGRVCCD